MLLDLKSLNEGRVEGVVDKCCGIVCSELVEMRFMYSVMLSWRLTSRAASRQLEAALSAT